MSRIKTIIQVVKIQKGGPGSAAVQFKETGPTKTVNTGGASLSEVKADPQIADAISKSHSLHSDDQNLSGLVHNDDGRLSDSRTPKSHSHPNDHAPHSDDQDLSIYVLKVVGKDLSTNDLTNLLKTAYDAAVTHAGSSHAPANALNQQQIMRLI